MAMGYQSVVSFSTPEVEGDVFCQIRASWLMIRPWKPSKQDPPVDAAVAILFGGHARVPRAGQTRSAYVRAKLIVRKM